MPSHPGTPSNSNGGSKPSAGSGAQLEHGLSTPASPGDTGVMRALAQSEPPAAKAKEPGNKAGSSSPRESEKSKRAPIEQLTDELAKEFHLGIRLKRLNEFHPFGLEGVVELINQGPPTRFHRPEIQTRFNREGWMVMLDRADPPEILIGICAEEVNGTLKNATAISVPFRDDLTRYVKGWNLDKVVSYVLLTHTEFDQLSKLVSSEAERKKFLGELDAEQSARANFFQLLDRAVSQRATDIHIEPVNETEYRIRLRVDGVLQHDGRYISAERGRALVRSIKVMGQSTVEDARKPWDGAINPDKKFLESVPNFSGRSLRISIMPTVNGEGAAIRILQSSEQGNLKLNNLNLDPELHHRLRTLISAPYGMLLVTGPTGSGKTTTLAAMLRELNTVDRKIVTLEDPVEQKIPGVIQSPMNAAIDYRFADGLRATLRHDPEVILVGEVRDAETAQIMTQGANTGHLMLSTIHTNDSISVFKRLRELGIDESQISASLLGVLSQRLVRCLCGSCKEQYDAREQLAKLFGRSGQPSAEILELPELTMYRAGDAARRGACGTCAGRGYRGRVAIPELWVIGEEERDLISRGETGHKALLQAALNGGMVPMSLAGLDYVRRGVTDIEEILGNVTRPDELIAQRSSFINHLRKMVQH